MKAILVIDMPKDCWDCHLVDEWGNCNAIKMTSERYGVSVKQYDKERASWCPLKPMPKEEDIYEVGMDEEDTNEERDNKPDWWVSVEADATKRKTTRRRRL